MDVNLLQCLFQPWLSSDNIPALQTVRDRKCSVIPLWDTLIAHVLGSYDRAKDVISRRRQERLVRLSLTRNEFFPESPVHVLDLISISMNSGRHSVRRGIPETCA